MRRLTVRDELSIRWDLCEESTRFLVGVTATAFIGAVVLPVLVQAFAWLKIVFVALGAAAPIGAAWIYKNRNH